MTKRSGTSCGRMLFCAAFAFAPLPSRAIEIRLYGSLDNCMLSRRLDAAKCANAAANAAAEWREKAPRYPTKSACERAYAAAGCVESDGQFAPSQSGFRVELRNRAQMTATPVVAGPALGFLPRSILRRDIHVNPHAALAAPEPATAPGGGAAPAEALEPAAASPHGPRPRVDSQFDCSAYLEPSEKDHADSGCYPVPARRR